MPCVHKIGKKPAEVYIKFATEYFASKAITPYASSYEITIIIPKAKSFVFLFSLIEKQFHLHPFKC